MKHLAQLRGDQWQAYATHIERSVSAPTLRVVAGALP